MEKRDGLKSPAKANKGEVFKCGECLHFKQTSHSKNDSICSELGIRSFAVAPPCYTPDYTKVISNSEELVALAAIFQNLTAQRKKILLGMLRLVPTGARYELGTKLYLRSSSRDYISNYLCGYVAGYTSANELALVGSPEHRATGKVFYAYLKSDAGLLTHKEWLAKEADLQQRGRIQDPKFSQLRDITKTVEADDYEVPTIDSAPKEKEAPRKKKRQPLTGFEF